MDFSSSGGKQKALSLSRGGNGAGGGGCGVQAPFLPICGVLPVLEWLGQTILFLVRRCRWDHSDLTVPEPSLRGQRGRAGGWIRGIFYPGHPSLPRTLAALAVRGVSCLRCPFHFGLQLQPVEAVLWSCSLVFSQSVQPLPATPGRLRPTPPSERVRSLPSPGARDPRGAFRGAQSSPPRPAASPPRAPARLSPAAPPLPGGQASRAGSGGEEREGGGDSLTRSRGAPGRPPAARCRSRM